MKKEDLNFMSISEKDSLKELYNNKTIYCLIFPYHNKSEIEYELKDIDINKDILPEGRLSYFETISYIDNFVNNNTNDELLIVTNNFNILLDIPSCMVRYVEKDFTLRKVNTEHFSANIHDIHLKTLKSDVKPFFNKKNNEHFDYLNELKDSNENISDKKYQELKMFINMIGEDMIRIKLNDILSELPRDTSDKEMSYIDKKIAMLEKKKEELINKNK